MSRLPIANRRGRLYYLGTVILEIRDHDGKELTGEQMHQMVKEFWPDLGPYRFYPAIDYFDLVRKIPYASDDERFPGRTIELVPRPLFILDRSIMPRVDCKKKAILMGAWAKANGLPYRFIASSERPDREIHHVFPQINFGEGWVNMDATFPNYRIGQGYPVTRCEELLG